MVQEPHHYFHAFQLQDLMQRNAVMEGGGGKAGKKERMQKEGGSSERSPTTHTARDTAQREAIEIAKK